MDDALRGVRALVTRPVGQAEPLLAAIRARGGEAVAFPLLEIAPVRDDEPELCAAIAATLDALDAFDLAIFISTNAVRHALARLHASGRRWPARPRCLAIGRATARCLAEAGIAAASAPGAMDSEELLAREELAAVAGRRIVIFKGVGGRDLLARRLSERGAAVTECAVYHRRAPRAEPAQLRALLRERAINVLLLSSAEALANLLGLLGEDAAGTIGPDLAVLAPGQRVAQLARASGFAVAEAAANATDAAMLDALARVAATLRRRAQT